MGDGFVVLPRAHHLRCCNVVEHQMPFVECIPCPGELNGAAFIPLDELAYLRHTLWLEGRRRLLAVHSIVLSAHSHWFFNRRRRPPQTLSASVELRAEDAAERPHDQPLISGISSP